jgi:Ca2+-binding RTX toxin-like protein
VQVTFMNGDPDRPIISGRVYDSDDSAEPDDKSLQVEITSVDGILDMSSMLEGGSGNDSLSLFFQGKLRLGGGTQSTPPVRELFDMGDGDDQVQIDFSELEIEGLGTQTPPIALDVRGGAGNDALSVTGTDGADRFAVNESMVVLEGVAAVGYAGFEFLRVDALAGNDTVTMTGIDPNTRTTIDGGAGRDRFIGRFASGFDGDLTLLNFEQASIKVRDGAETSILGGDAMIGPVAVRLVSERDEGENFLMV